MRTANQLTFTTYETSLKLKPNDPIKIIFENINWSFIHPLSIRLCLRAQKATILYPCLRLSF